MWLKKDPCDDVWWGPDATDVHNISGYEVLRTYPTRRLRIIRGTPIPAEDFSHVRKTYDWLPRSSKQWWEGFHVDQFFWIPDQTDPLRHPWNVFVPDERPNAIPETASSRNLNKRPAINIPFRVPTTVNSLKINMLVAVRAQKHFSEDVSNLEKRFLLPKGERREPFWIGAISSIRKKSHDVVIYFYRRDYSMPRKYVLDPLGSSGVCALNSILLHDFELTKAGSLLRTVTLKQLRLFFELSSSEDQGTSDDDIDDDSDNESDADADDDDDLTSSNSEESLSLLNYTRTKKTKKKHSRKRKKKT